MRRLCLPRDHVSVSENCACRLCTSVSRDWPMVNGTDPARAYAVDSCCASQSVTGSPSLKPARTSLRRLELRTDVSLALIVADRREYLRATLGALVPPTASLGFVS